MNRQRSRPMGARPWAFLLMLLGPALSLAESPVIEYDAKSKCVAVRGIATETLRNWRAEPPADWTKLFAVYVGASKTPILGRYSVDDGQLIFKPRFPFERGLKYRVEFQLAPGGSVVQEIQLPKAVATATITQVYPSGDRLPENQLKFYLHFSAPMRRGEAYQRVHLLDEKGNEVEAPFLELGEELWDPAGKRFTLFLHPGRIKRGLQPREELGPPLLAGKKYTLVIDGGWLDAEGSPLKSGFRKSFSVGKPDDVQPDPKNWKLSSPAAGKTTALVVGFPEPLDQALLQRLLSVVDATGQAVPGRIETARNESEWRFLPAKPWQPGPYRLKIGTELEDLAGNSIARPFEVDQFKKIDERVERKQVELKFTVQ